MNYFMLQTLLICKKEKKRHVRSGGQEVFYKNAFLKTLQNLQNAYTPVLESLDYNDARCLKIYLKKSSKSVLSANFVKLLRTPF